jgi:ribosomal protein S18 acetylase RimI-like enzyme
MNSLQVRAARREDAPVLAAFNRAMAQETEGKELTLVERGVQRMFEDPTLGRYFVACDGDDVVGCLMLTTEWSDWRDGVFWWIQSVYVAPAHRQRGVYRALHAHVEAAARAQGDVVGLRLYVERHNARAQATYAKLGMRDAGYVVMEQPIERAR